MDAASFSKILVPVNQFSSCHAPKDRNFDLRWCEKRKSRKQKNFFNLVFWTYSIQKMWLYSRQTWIRGESNIIDKGS